MDGKSLSLKRYTFPHNGGMEVLDSQIVTSLGEVGVPAAIISAAVITAVFKPIHQKLALGAGALTLVIIVLYLPVQLYPQYKNMLSKPTLEVSESKVHVFNELGKPTDFSVKCKNGSDVLDTFDIKSNFPASWADRDLSLVLHEQSGNYQVRSNGDLVGMLNAHTLKNLGWVKASNIKPCSRPYFVDSSKKVYVGEQWVIGNVSETIGDLTLQFVAIEKGEAKISLSSSKLSPPKPDSLSIKNKSFDSQVFESKFEIMVQVSQADFTGQLGEQWAAFTVIVSE